MVLLFLNAWLMWLFEYFNYFLGFNTFFKGFHFDGNPLTVQKARMRRWIRKVSERGPTRVQLCRDEGEICFPQPQCLITVCPRSLVLFDDHTCYIDMDKTSWTYCTKKSEEENPNLTMELTFFFFQGKFNPPKKHFYYNKLYLNSS